MQALTAQKFGPQCVGGVGQTVADQTVPIAPAGYQDDGEGFMVVTESPS